MTGIIGAMEEEVAALKEAMEVQEAAELASMTFYRGVLCGTRGCTRMNPIRQVTRLVPQ